MAKTWTPRRVTSEDERYVGSSAYIQLDEGEKFLGHALFEGNPAEDETGYYEYFEHWNNASRKSIPCAGEDCPFCEDGDKPKTRAKSLWFVVKDAKGNEVNELRIFNLNFNLIKQFTEMRGEGDKIKGRVFRVTKLDDRGNYGLMPKTEIMKAGEVKELLKSKDAPNFEDAVTSQLNKAMEAVALHRALSDDDDDPEETETKAKSNGKAKGKGKESAAKAKKKADWPDEADDLEVTVDEVDDDNFVLISSDDYDGQEKVFGTTELDLTDIEDGAVITLSYITDDEDDKVATEFGAEEAVKGAEPDDDDPEPDDELPDIVEDIECEVISVDAAESTMEVKSEELDIEFTLYFLDSGPASEVDFDDYEPGTKITVTAEKDTAGDLVATAIPEVVKSEKAKGGKSAGKGKGKKKGK